MNTVRLGKTGLTVSRIGIGGIPIQRPPEEEAVKIIQHALDLGITLIDTSLGYGTSEERIGKAIHGCRDDVIIATKGGWSDKTVVLNHIDQSLKRLRTDYIDLWQFHGVNTLEAYEKVLGPGGAYEGAQEALKTGKIRHIGISSHSLNVALKAVSSDIFETIQFPLNFISDEAAEELVPLARTHDVGFIGMKPFAGSNIRDAFLAIKYVLQFSNVVPIPGIQRAEEIDEIVNIVNKGPWEITVEDRKKIEDIRAELGTRFCRQCGYCMPCAQGVNIPMVMIAQLMWRLWPQELYSNPEWWFGTVMKSAKNCIQCGECEPKCPYNLPIRELIPENVEFYEQVTQNKLE
ncbi:MAG: aldo/keto reductase [Theionarchaea archaeon]|nr:aldo/keto reductase [Theionarchaea archaeon]